jgi:membrane-associated phospholipid phosphatase
MRRRVRALVLLAGTAFLSSSVCAGEADCEATDPACPAPRSGAVDVVKAYVTAPLRWDSSDWWYFGGTIAAIGIAHALDGPVRTRFTHGSPSTPVSTNTHDLQDALPAAALFAGTFGYAELIDDQRGRKEAGSMLESAVLSVGTAYLLKFAAGRQRPDQTGNPNRWWAGGSSFPSVHATAAFAIGSVLAESGNDEYRWIRRVLGYGVAGFTVYERLDHNAHWLSDTVAGAALGNATARFVMNRHRAAAEDATVAIEPLYHGVMLTYTAHLP